MVAGARKLAKGEDFTEALQMMAQAFEGLDNAEGVVPWEPGTLLAWAQEQRREVELMALFVVSLEDPEGVELPMHEAAGLGRLERAGVLDVGGSGLVGAVKLHRARVRANLATTAATG